jgi:hypothetical protein
MPRGHGLLRRPVNDRSWRDLTVKTGVNKRQGLAACCPSGVVLLHVGRDRLSTMARCRIVL